MLNIVSPQFSVIRLGEDDTPCLPIYDRYCEAFHFIVQDDVPIADKFYMGVVSTNGTLLTDFGQAAVAQMLTRKAKLSEVGTTFWLESITVGGSGVYYDIQVTDADLLTILARDFGFRIKDGYFILDCPVDIEIKAAVNKPYSSYINFSFTYYWYEGYVRATGDTIPYDQGQELHYALLDNGLDLATVSNKFIVINDTDAAYHSWLSYGCNESAFGFAYAGEQPNIVLLPVWLHSPTYPKKQSQYVKSDGSTVLLSATLEKNYVFETEAMTEWYHERMAIAMAHDDITITNPVIGEVKVLDKDTYTPQWLDKERATRVPARTRVVAARYGYTNSNCGARECCAPIVTVGSITTSSAQLLFDYPSSVTHITIYYRTTEMTVWSSKTIAAASSYTLAPLTPGKTYQVKAASVCGVEPGLESRVHTFTVDSLPCTPVAVVGSVTLPDGEVGSAYNYDIMLSGTKPYSLSIISKPPWMSIVIGSMFDDFGVHITGTPMLGDEGEDITVHFKIGNCGGSSEITINQTIDIIDNTPSVGTPVDVKFHEDIGSVCSAGTTTLYLAPPDMNIGIGATLYIDSGLTVPVGPGYVVQEGFIEIYQIGALGEVVSFTGTC